MNKYTHQEMCDYLKAKFDGNYTDHCTIEKETNQTILLRFKRNEQGIRRWFKPTINPADLIVQAVKQ